MFILCCYILCITRHVKHISLNSLIIIDRVYIFSKVGGFTLKLYYISTPSQILMKAFTRCSITIKDNHKLHNFLSCFSEKLKNVFFTFELLLQYLYLHMYFSIFKNPNIQLHLRSLWWNPYNERENTHPTANKLHTYF